MFLCISLQKLYKYLAVTRTIEIFHFDTLKHLKTNLPHQRKPICIPLKIIM